MRSGRTAFIRAAGWTLLLALGLYGALAACAHREIPFSEIEARYGSPASQFFEPAAGVRVHFTDEGPRDAPALILVHGFAASTHAWRPWAERLRGGYRVIALDLPGHGLTRTPRGYRVSLASNAALVDALAEELKLPSFVLAGNSMGGAVALTYAVARAGAGPGGGRLRALVLVNPAGWPGEGGADGPPWFARVLMNPVGRTLIKAFDPRLFAESGLKVAYLDPALVDEALIERYVDLALAEGRRDVLLMMDSRGRDVLTRAAIGGIATPTLVMAGEQDRIIPVDQARALATAIPGAELVVYPEGGHVPMEQLPDRSAQDLERFLQALPALQPQSRR